MVISGFANTGGLGGGALMSPVLLIGFNYDATKAIQIVYSLVFGGAVGNFLNVVRVKDKSGKPVVDYDLSMVCMPPMLLGATLGVLLNRMSPPVVIIAGLIMLLIFVFLKVMKKANVEYKKESIKIAELKASMQPVLNDGTSQQDTSTDQSQDDISINPTDDKKSGKKGEATTSSMGV
eukprot:CAMPEP_0114578864 /NCGR_PEP_ID=MMETSP0125-20121206/3350_1 /TAXON_ID=485358 ORGANISM="Aristerostoma sp., Strain ATCC 50986" /NCGR_SAMPLE_ID=MMETSP0125 /ASSEMBLY_ACC=CAM_ASM_000245 /LENGTH=177 /DNA_ID=CAMNT_0001769253 /DNA_START=220 /DNA_END=753 /DNA_ORIENTATION=-